MEGIFKLDVKSRHTHTNIYKKQTNGDGHCQKTMSNQRLKKKEKQNGIKNIKILVIIARQKTIKHLVMQRCLE